MGACGIDVEPELKKASDQNLQRSLDHRSPVLRPVEKATGEKRPGEPVEAKAVAPPKLPERGKLIRMNRLPGDKIADCFSRQESGSGRLPENQVNRSIAIQCSRLPKQSLLTGISEAPGDDKAVWPVPVASETASQLLDVRFGVVSLAQGEKLQQLSGKVLVRPAAGVAVEIKIPDHRRRTAHRFGEIRKGPSGTLAENPVVLEKGTWIADRGGAHDKHIEKKNQPALKAGILASPALTEPGNEMLIEDLLPEPTGVSPQFRHRCLAFCSPDIPDLPLNTPELVELVRRGHRALSGLEERSYRLVDTLLNSAKDEFRGKGEAGPGKEMPGCSNIPIAGGKGLPARKSFKGHRRGFHDLPGKTPGMFARLQANRSKATAP